MRRRGYATNHEESEPGITAVGRCAPDRDGRAFGAVVIAVPSLRGKAGHLEDLAGHLQVFAAAVARAL